MIHFLEENKVKQPKKRHHEYIFSFVHQQEQRIAYGDIYKESIICHHNAIADYIKENFLDLTQGISFESVINCCNYHFFPADMEYIGEIIDRPESTNGFNVSQLCPSLTQITIPSSVTTIGDSAFSDCSSLTQITIPSSVTTIGDSAFSDCSSLTQITIPSSVTSIGKQLINKGKKLAISGNIKAIFSNMFDCSFLIEISIPPSVITIENMLLISASFWKKLKLHLLWFQLINMDLMNVNL